jgi:hypothetical protein
MIRCSVTSCGPDLSWLKPCGKLKQALAREVGSDRIAYAEGKERPHPAHS